jgi:hypothetical protein
LLQFGGPYFRQFTRFPDAGEKYFQKNSARSVILSKLPPGLLAAWFPYFGLAPACFPIAKKTTCFLAKPREPA